MSRNDDATWLRNEAMRCRRLASGIADSLTSDRLGKLAMEYDGRAKKLEDGHKIYPPVRS
jgi:hypothetical protein